MQEESPAEVVTTQIQNCKVAKQPESRSKIVKEKEVSEHPSNISKWTTSKPLSRPEEKQDEIHEKVPLISIKIDYTNYWPQRWQNSM